MIGSWNTAQEAYGKKEGWDTDAQTLNVLIVQSVTTGGAAIGALFSGSIAHLGKWNCIIISNIVLIVGVALTLVPDFYFLCVGRGIYGISVGAFSVFCPKYISETAPVEIKGPAGAASQVCITLGILIAFAIGLGIGDVDAKEVDSFEIQYYWYIIFSIPLFFSFLQLILLTTCYNYDTPVILKQQGRFYDLLRLLEKIY